jgi:hypothetical protein
MHSEICQLNRILWTGLDFGLKGLTIRPLSSTSTQTAVKVPAGAGMKLLSGLTAIIGIRSLLFLSVFTKPPNRGVLKFQTISTLIGTLPAHIPDIYLLYSAICSYSELDFRSNTPYSEARGSVADRSWAGWRSPCDR